MFIHKSKFLVVLILALLSEASQGQYFQAQRGLRDGIYAEIYILEKEFSEGLVSLNYEKFLGYKYKNSVRVGILSDFKSSVSFPVTFSYITHPYENHHLEVGAGFILNVDFFEGSAYFDFASGMFPIMYRYTNKDKRFYFRGGVNIFYSRPFIPNPSASIGYRF